MKQLKFSMLYTIIVVLSSCEGNVSFTKSIEPCLCWGSSATLVKTHMLEAGFTFVEEDSGDLVYKNANGDEVVCSFYKKEYESAYIMSTELIMLQNFAQRNYKQIISADIDGTWYLFRTSDEKTAVMYGQEAEVGWLQFAPLDSDIYEEWLEMFLETK